MSTEHGPTNEVEWPLILIVQSKLKQTLHVSIDRLTQQCAQKIIGMSNRVMAREILTALFFGG